MTVFKQAVVVLQGCAEAISRFLLAIPQAEKQRARRWDGHIREEASIVELNKIVEVKAQARLKFAMDRDNVGGVATDSTGCPLTTPTSASSKACSRAGARLCLSPAIKLEKPPDLVEIMTGGVFLQTPTTVKVSKAAVVGLPCRFTLREKLRTQEQPNDSDGYSRRATMAHIVSPHRRPLLLRRVLNGTQPRNAVGYSPQLRNTGAEGSTGRRRDTTIVPGSPAPFFFEEPSSLTSHKGVASRRANATAAACGATSPASTGRRATITPCGGCFHIDAVGAVGKHDVEFEKGETRAHEAAHNGHIPTQEHRLCGRLRKATTTASPKLATSHHDHGGGSGGATNNPRARTLFLVSGEQQQRPVDTARRLSTGNMAPLKRRSQFSRCQRSRVFPSAVSLPSTTGSRAGRAKTVPPGDWRKPRCRTRSLDGVRTGGDDGGGRGRDKEVEPLPVSTSGPADEELGDADSAGVTPAGGGFACSGKRVVHVRVPRPPPTSRFLLRSARSRSSAA